MAPVVLSPASARSAAAVTTRTAALARGAAPITASRRCRVAAAAANEQQQQIAVAAPTPSRRAALLSAASSFLVLGSPSQPALANPPEDATRAVLRPANALTDEEAVAALLDARSTLKDLAQLAATPPDSRERFEGRKLWPAFARWLRPAGPAAPRVVSLALGGKDAEATLSARYGGAAAGGGDEAAAASSSQQPLGDELYRSLGAVLTISGRTIREEAQASPERALRAAAAIDGVLERVPADVKDGAQALRVAARAARGK